MKPQPRRMQERAAAGWRTFDSASIEWFPAVTDFTMFSVERLDKTEAHKALHWTARCCASLECDMFDDKKLAQEDNKSPCANALLQVTNTI